ncbi:MAG: O-antigen ligase family protein [Pseudomonadota bacterium]
MDQFSLSYRFSFLLIALCLYGVLGSPTPDNPGVTELIIGCFLVLAASFSVFDFKSNHERWKSVLSVSLIYGLSVMVMNAFLNNNDSGMVLRDIIAFFFLLTPLFFYDVLARNPRAFKCFSIALIFIGVCFSVRALLPIYGFYEAPDELLYLANSPLVLLTALFLVGVVFSDIYNRAVTLRTAMVLGLSVIPFMAMLIDVQRAPMAAVFITMGFALCVMMYFRPKRAAVMLMIFLFSVLMLAPVIEDIVFEILSKTSRVGMNMRVEELRAVFDAIGQNPFTVLLGLGWGASFEAPSVGGLHVPYTHSLLSYFLLKGGLIGLGLVSVFCVMVGRELLKIMNVQPVFGFALLWPFFIPVFLYASHKSLDFGLVLLFIFLYARVMDQGHAYKPLTHASVALPNGSA